MKLSSVLRRTHSGFTLMELLLAMAIFAISIMSLIEALNTLGETVVDSVEVGSVREGMRSMLTELSHSGEFQSGKRVVEDETTGFSYEIEISPVDELRDGEGKALRGIYEASLAAFRLDSNGRREELGNASTYLYYPGSRL